jgi:nicotinamide mononucleotide transporter
MRTYTDAALPYADATIVALSLVAQWLMARKKLESWIGWIAVDVLGIAVYSMKELYITAGLYGVFLVLASLGLLSWAKSLREREGSSLASSCPRTGDTSSSSSLPGPSAPT